MRLMSLWFVKIFKKFLLVQKKLTRMSALKVIMVFFAIAALYVISSLILYGTWNYTIPVLVNSINGPTQPTFRNISIPDAMVFMILIWTILGPGAIVSGLWTLTSKTTETITNRSMRNAAAYNLNPAVSTQQAPQKLSGLNSGWNQRR